MRSGAGAEGTGCDRVGEDRIARVDDRAGTPSATRAPSWRRLHGTTRARAAAIVRSSVITCGPPVRAAGDRDRNLAGADRRRGIGGDPGTGLRGSPGRARVPVRSAIPRRRRVLLSPPAPSAGSLLLAALDDDDPRGGVVPWRHRLGEMHGHPSRTTGRGRPRSRNTRIHDRRSDALRPACRQPSVCRSRPVRRLMGAVPTGKRFWLGSAGPARTGWSLEEDRFRERCLRSHRADPAAVTDEVITEPAARVVLRIATRVPGGQTELTEP